jgi:SAM-dependent methyltransferase
MYDAVRDSLPRPLHRWLLYFEASIEDAVDAFADTLPRHARVLDAGAGEGQYKAYFPSQRYTGIDLAVGDKSWNYSRIDVRGDLAALPFATGSFDAALNIVTLEHVTDPEAVLRELHRVLDSGASLLLIAPLEWEVHQAPHDYFRYTRYGLRLLLERAGFVDARIEPMGGLFRLLSRRLLNALQFFHGVWFVIAAILLVPPALVLPLFDALDRGRDFTLGYQCTARKR